jgi:hypothetical protein
MACLLSLILWPRLRARQRRHGLAQLGQVRFFIPPLIPRLIRVAWDDAVTNGCQKQPSDRRVHGEAEEAVDHGAVAVSTLLARVASLVFELDATDYPLRPPDRIDRFTDAELELLVALLPGVGRGASGGQSPFSARKRQRRSAARTRSSYSANATWSCMAPSPSARLLGRGGDLPSAVRPATLSASRRGRATANPPE